MYCCITSTRYNQLLEYFEEIQKKPNINIVRKPDFSNSVYPVYFNLIYIDKELKNNEYYKLEKDGLHLYIPEKEWFNTTKLPSIKLNINIFNDILLGVSTAELMSKYGISRSRVPQIATRMCMFILGSNGNKISDPYIHPYTDDKYKWRYSDINFCFSTHLIKIKDIVLYPEFWLKELERFTKEIDSQIAEQQNNKEKK